MANRNLSIDYYLGVSRDLFWFFEFCADCQLFEYVKRVHRLTNYTYRQSTANKFHGFAVQCTLNTLPARCK